MAMLAPQLLLPPLPCAPPPAAASVAARTWHAFHQAKDHHLEAVFTLQYNL
jgi:hypothetical protein